MNNDQLDILVSGTLQSGLNRDEWHAIKQHLDLPHGMANRLAQGKRLPPGIANVFAQPSIPENGYPKPIPRWCIWPECVSL